MDVDVKTKGRLVEEGELRRLATFGILEDPGEDQVAYFNHDLAKRVAARGGAEQFTLEDVQDFLKS
ncbi:unnamed protein product, partial [Amoebophrya sp. A120]|eukprot:GSA120T00022346001.1